ncbi:MAG: RHS repeat-associated core domain-containing protein [Gemmatimonas sp.]
MLAAYVYDNLGRRTNLVRGNGTGEIASFDSAQLLGSLGRFLQTDPVGFGGGMNLYAYVGNDPVNATDPSGLVPACDEGVPSPCEVTILVSNNDAAVRRLMAQFSLFSGWSDEQARLLMSLVPPALQTETHTPGQRPRMIQAQASESQQCQRARNESAVRWAVPGAFIGGGLAGGSCLASGAATAATPWCTAGGATAGAAGFGALGYALGGLDSRCSSGSSSTAVGPSRNDCDAQWDRERGQCFADFPRGSWELRGCLQRAEARYLACRSGSPLPDPWGPPDMDPGG